MTVWLLKLDAWQRDRLFQPVANRLQRVMSREQLIGFCGMGFGLSVMAAIYMSWKSGNLGLSIGIPDLVALVAASNITLFPDRRVILSQIRGMFIIRTFLTSVVLSVIPATLALLVLGKDVIGLNSMEQLSSGSALVWYWASDYFAACKKPPPRHSRSVEWRSDWSSDLT